MTDYRIGPHRPTSTRKRGAGVTVRSPSVDLDCSVGWNRMIRKQASRAHGFSSSDLQRHSELAFYTQGRI